MGDFRWKLTPAYMGVSHRPDWEVCVKEREKLPLYILVSQPASLIRLRTEGGTNPVWGLCGGISSLGYPAGEYPDGTVELTR